MSDCYADGFGYRRCYGYSGWYSYGRWILLGGIIAAVIVIYIGVSCITARSRRRAGRDPFIGTAWTLGRTPTGHAPAEYQPQVEQIKEATPPAYNAGQGDLEQQQQQQQPPQPRKESQVPQYAPPPGQPPAS